MSASCNYIYNWSKFVILIILISSSISVDKHNFKTCQESSFCRYQREKNQNDSFSVKEDSVVIEPTSVNFLLQSSKTSGLLDVQLFGLVHNSLRLKINEVKPRRQRYEIPVGDVLISEPIQSNLKVLNKDDSRLELGLDDFTKILIHFDPFSIDIFTHGIQTTSFNDRGLLNFERTRSKKKNGWFSWVPNLFGSTEQNATDEEEKDKNWEETFKTHKDTRPYGPSSVGMDIFFPGFQFVYGIPEHSNMGLALQSTNGKEPYRLYNLDVFEFELDNNMALYGSVPLMIAHNAKQTVGLLWLNAAETWIDVDISSESSSNDEEEKVSPNVDTHWFSESGIVDVFLMLGTSASDVFFQYSKLTGTTPLPPLFAIAYHQSRWNYIDEQDVSSIIAGFDEHTIPLDVLWLDIEHADGKRYFTWDKHKFPNPDVMLKNVSSTGRKMVTAVDPHLRRDSNYYVYSEAKSLSYFVNDRDGSEYEGWCWPGSSSWLDFTNPDIRKFWAEKFEYSQYKGSTPDLFTWNDMNEPSVFNGPEVTMHKDAQHYGGWEHRDVHNVFGIYVHRATFEGQLLRSNGQHRPFVLSRSFFAGSQRYGAVWTGDNAADWEHLQVTIPMMLSLNLAGITFSGADVGGFFKNPSPELLTRWYQAATFQPFFRAHAHLDTKRREPWLMPPEHMTAIRDAINIRYRLLAYWYTLFFNAEQFGGPVMKPLWVEFPQEVETFNIFDEHMIGDAILIHPVTVSQAVDVNIYFPGCGANKDSTFAKTLLSYLARNHSGLPERRLFHMKSILWYDMDNYQVFKGCQRLNIEVNLNKIPAFYRGGHIIPIRERIRRSSTVAPDDPFSLIILLDEKGSSEGQLYHDDLFSFQYRAGHYVHRSFKFIDNLLISRSLNLKGSFETRSWIERIYVVGLEAPPKQIHLQLASENVPVHLESSYNPDNRLLIIRKPGVSIATDFSISLV